MRLIAGNSSYIDLSEVELLEGYVTPYLEYLRQIVDSRNYANPEGLLNLPFDDHALQEVLAIATKFKSPKLRYILLIGIGGSSLGAKALYDALLGSYDIIDPLRTPKVVFVDTSEPEFLGKMIKFLSLVIEDPDEIVINAVSKSGTTTETIVNVEVILDSLKKKFGSAIQNRVVITTEKDSSLAGVAKDNNITCIEIERSIPGRFSVFSAVGLFPLALLGIDIEAFRKGAADMMLQCLGESLPQNPAAISAIFHFHHYRENMRTSDNFFFHPQLESLGKWYRQLLAESLGKEKDLEGNTVRSGILPVISIGSSDLHSVTQLTLAGPRDRITSFIWSEHVDREIEIPASGTFLDLVSGIAYQPVSKVMQAILRGTKAAYDKEGLPYIEIILPGITPYAIGEFMQFKMIEVMILAQLMKINAFDQPKVEIYKEETRKILNS